MVQNSPHDFLFAHPALRDRNVSAAEIRQTVRRLLNIDLAKPLEIVSEEQGRQGTFWTTQLLFKSSNAKLLRATIMRPGREGIYPGVVVCPGRNAKLSFVTGAEPPDYPDRAVSERLTAAGMTTMTIEYELDTHEAPLSVLVQNAVSAVSLLSNDRRIEPNKIALFGHSLGAHVALCTALVRNEELPVALASFLSPYPTMFKNGNDLTKHLYPSSLRNSDTSVLATALAPAPLQVQHGLLDPRLPIDETRSMLEFIRQNYASDSLSILTPRMTHGTDIPQLCNFLKTSLKMAPREKVSVPAALVHFDDEMRREILDGIDRALATGVLTLGPLGEQFERLAQQWTGARYTVAVSSGTAALEIALRSVGVEGRRVIVPANTFFATALAVLHAGARPEFVDTEPAGLALDPVALAEALEKHSDVAAVVVVHIGGIVAPSVLTTLEICKKRGIPLIEDAAHALGSTLNETFAGNIGDIAAFSMYPTKVVTSGEGGFIAARSEMHARDAQLRRDQGKRSFHLNVHDRIGSNWRMSELHASVGLATLKRLDGFLRERRELAARYDEALSNQPGLRPLSVPAGSSSNYYKYIVLLDEGVNREDLKRRLKANYDVSLAGDVYQIPCCAQPYFQGRYSEEEFPSAYDFCRRHICLPLFPTMTIAQQDAVVQALAIELAQKSIYAD